MLKQLQTAKEVLIKSFDRLRTSGKLLIPFVVSLSNHERNPFVRRFPRSFHLILRFRSVTREQSMSIVNLVILVAMVLVIMSLRIVKEYDCGVIFFLGKVTGLRGPGLIILIPILERMTKITLRTITMNIPSQKIITKDNVS